MRVYVFVVGWGVVGLAFLCLFPPRMHQRGLYWPPAAWQEGLYIDYGGLLGYCAFLIYVVTAVVVTYRQMHRPQD